MEKYILCDLDGCLLNTAWIWKLVPEEIPKYKKIDIFNALANTSRTTIDEGYLRFIKKWISEGFKIHFITSRSEKIAVETIIFIGEKTELKLVTDYTISFRAADDIYPSAESKRKRVREMLNQKKKIQFATDDSPEIINLYNSMGIRAYLWEDIVEFNEKEMEVK